MNNYSAPMPFNRAVIDGIVEVNKQTKNNKITVLYNNLPGGDPENLNLDVVRSFDYHIDFDDFIELVHYSKSKGFDFIYLLNAPVLPSYHLTKSREKAMNRLFEKLLKSGITKIRMSDPMLIGFAMKHYPEINVYCSTTQEHHTIRHYLNLFKEYSNIKEVVLGNDINKDFAFIDSFRKKFPHIHMELMVNEDCISGCPWRLAHTVIRPPKHNKPVCTFDFLGCKLYSLNLVESIFLSNVIYPWTIKTYVKHGIDSFKFVGRSATKLQNGTYLRYYYSFMRGVEDEDFLNDLPLSLFNRRIHLKPVDEKLTKMTIGEIKPFMPKIEYIEKKYGTCAIDCTVNCNHCYQKAKKVNDLFGLKVNTL
ncbi:MAG: U32 family peptidase [Candidatus Roizmanbacteria bacterium]|nr:U32 family peptidase [Candidatus Roizmanbacteria bacterium]